MSVPPIPEEMGFPDTVSMKIHREGAKIIVEVEESDAPEGLDLEIVADALMTSMKFFASKNIIQKTKSEYDKIKEKVAPELEETIEDFMERWEITR